MFGICKHNWEIIVNEKVQIHDPKTGKISKTGWMIVQRCKKCGKIKRNIVEYK